LLPLDCLTTGHDLGNLGFKEGNWQIAIEGFEKAIAAVEISRSWAMSARRRQEIINESIGIYEKMLRSCINANRLDLALQTIERVRSKRLVDLMAAPDLYPQGEIPEPVRLILERIATTQQQMDNLRSRVQTSASELASSGTRDRAAIAPPTAEIHALEAQKQYLLEELSRYDAVSAQLVEISPPDITQIQTELLDRPDVALLSFYTTTQDTHILIVRSNSIQCFTCSGQGLEQLQRLLFDEWVLPYINDRVSWEQNMPQHLQQLAEKLELDRLVAEHLQNIRELILIPHLLLHMIPFAALPLNGNPQYLGDRFLLRYAPGCQVLKFCTDRNELPSQQKYGTVENTTEDLPFSAIEGEAIAQIFQIEEINRLRGSQQATRDAYKQLLARVNFVASCHHAQSRLDNPLESSLILANETRVTLGDLLSPGWRFADLGDVFLSCCETGMTMPKSLTDELLTIGTGFLCAGARSVISSLWAVSDIATALLSQIYHQYRAQGQDRIVALQKAQQDLRRISGEQLQAKSQAEFIPALETQQEQLEQRRQAARRQKQQSEQKHYGELIDRIEQTIMALESLWEKSLPFDHPVYWAPFTCQGLR
jgi:CHAT domain-containing protein